MLTEWFSLPSVNVIYVPCHWFSCFCAFSKVTVNVLDVIVVVFAASFNRLSFAISEE